MAKDPKGAKESNRYKGENYMGEGRALGRQPKKMNALKG